MQNKVTQRKRTFSKSNEFMKSKDALRFYIRKNEDAFIDLYNDYPHLLEICRRCGQICGIHLGNNCPTKKHMIERKMTYVTKGMLGELKLNTNESLKRRAANRFKELLNQIKSQNLCTN